MGDLLYGLFYKVVFCPGLPRLIKADMVKPGATIIDVGISRITDDTGKTKLVGDVDYDGKFFYFEFIIYYA